MEISWYTGEAGKPKTDCLKESSIGNLGELESGYIAPTLSSATSRTYLHLRQLAILHLRIRLIGEFGDA